MRLHLMSYCLLISCLAGVAVIADGQPQLNHRHSVRLAVKQPEDARGTGSLHITPLYDQPNPATPPLEDLDQCPGTVQHYRLPPTGYTPAPENASSRQGKQLYDKLGCASCHAIGDKGGTLGPPLDGIGGHRGKQFLEARLLNPAAQMRDFPDVFGGRPNIMPHPGVSSREASQIAQYLLTLAEPTGGFLITAHPPVEQPEKPPTREKPKLLPEEQESAKQGAKLFLDHGCAMCHVVEGPGTRFGPRLDGISQRRNREALVYLLSGGAKEPVMKTRSLELKVNEVESIVDFLWSLPETKYPERNEQN